MHLVGPVEGEPIERVPIERKRSPMTTGVDAIPSLEEPARNSALNRAPGVHGEPPVGRQQRWSRAVQRQPMWITARRALLLVLAGVCAGFLVHRWGELRGAFGLIGRADLRWIGLALLFEAASMVVFARLQRRLLRAGGVTLPLRTMVELTVAGNAIATTVPGGVALAAGWEFGQLERRGVNRFLRVWMFLVAGALSSFALFLLVAIGIFVAGAHGPVADLRWAVVSLAAIPVAALGIALARHWTPIESAVWALVRLVRSVPGGGQMARWTGTLQRRLRDIRMAPLQWAGVLGLATLNWLYDCAVLVCSLVALNVPVPWKGVFVIYGISQVAGALPVTPGGLVVVEGSMAALLTAYGVHPRSAFAVIILYRAISFWGLVPLGWGVWFGLDIVQRRRKARESPLVLDEDRSETSAPVLVTAASTEQERDVDGVASERCGTGRAA
jgi:uncharacterized membrane protein YbhN (UPF0104 family)